MAPNNSTNEYVQLLNELGAFHVPKVILDSLSGYVKSIHQSEIEDPFKAPMLSIGLYVAFASLVCVVAMLADVLHGLRSCKLWFPCNYFRINSFFLTVISVAMKLPMDLTSSMPGVVDQVAKTGSLAFMCTIMANLLPCLSTMADNDLYSNMAALSVLVITIVVNVCIQMKTGVVSPSTYVNDPRITAHNVTSHPKWYTILPIIYVTLLVVLVILYVSSCIGVLTFKKIIESRYQEGHYQASEEIQRESEGFFAVKDLEEYVRAHWVMATSGRSQFVFTGYFQTTSASGVICVIVAILHILTVSWSFKATRAKDYDSDYRWSVIVIVFIQLIGVVTGTIAPLCRCFAPIISFSLNIPSDYLSVRHVENFWTEKLHAWKAARNGLPSYNVEVVIRALRWVIVSFCIRFQVIVVVLCKIIASSLYKISGLFSSSVESLSPDYAYVIIPTNGLVISKTNVYRLFWSGRWQIQKGEKNQPHFDLLQKSTPGFHGLGSLKVNRRLNFWSLQVVTLATIACSLPKIEKEQLDWLMANVRDCLKYVILVDESLNNSSQSWPRAVKVMWDEVDIDRKWLGNKLPNTASSQFNTAREVLRWFKNIVNDLHSSTPSITAKLRDEDHMRPFSEVMSSYIFHLGDDNVPASQLFERLSSITADTIVACVTNLPQVILNKCHPSKFDELETSVKGAALLLGETKQIIEKLPRRGIPDIDPSDMPFIDKWCDYLWSKSQNPENHVGSSGN